MSKAKTDTIELAEKVNVNLSSPKQMIQVFKDLGVNVVTDEFKESISEDILKSQHMNLFLYGLNIKELNMM